MAAKVGDFSLILKLLGGIIIGALLGLYIGENAEGSLRHVMDVVVSLRHIFGQIIFFLVPLVIVGFITPAIVRLGQNASKILLVAVGLAYISSLGAALFSMISGYCIIPNLSIATSTETLRSLPEMVFRLDIPPLFSVMSALVLALTMGVAIVWTRSETLGKIFCEMERIMTALVNRIMIPILPFFVGLSFLGLAYEGSLSRHLPVFIMMVLIVIVGHFIWLAVLYGIGGALSGRNPSQVFRHYAPAYLTAVGTMSSAATLPVALECARKSPVLSRTMVEFMVPLGATVHLCGSVLTETFFVMVVSKVLYGTLPAGQVLSYALAALEAAQDPLAALFDRLLQAQFGRRCRADAYRCYDGGGIGAQIGQDVVLVGSLPFMRSMGVHMSDGARVRQAVYVSVNGELAGIFAVKYKPSASTRAGLRALLANPGNSVILATRDFLITPELLAARYELAVGGIAFPVYSERLRLSEAVGGEADAQGALIAKETFGAFASAVAAAQTLRSTTRFSTVLSLLSGILGLCLCALLLYWGSAAAVSPFHIAAFQLIWALVAGFLSGILQRL